MPEKINQTLDINQDNKLDTKDIVEMQKIMETVKDSPEAMNQYIFALTKEIHKLDKKLSKDLLDACSTILDSGNKLPKEIENSLKNLKLQAKAIYGIEAREEEKVKIQKSGIESKKEGYDKVMRSLNIAVSKRDNFKKLIDKVFDKVGEKKFGKLIKAIEDKHGTSKNRDTLINLIRSESLDNKNIDDILYKLEKGEDFSDLVEKAKKEDKKEEEKEKKLEKAKEKFDIKQLADYFGINENKAKKLSIKLSEIGLDATIFLNKYKVFIETKLTGLKDIPNGDKYLKKIKLSIGRRFLNLDIQKIMDEKLGGLEKGESIKNSRWIMNEILQNKFNFVNTELFPSVQFLIKEGGKIDGIKGSGSGNIRKKIKETLKMLNADVLENGDFDKTWKSGELIDANTDTWNIFDTDGTLSGSTDSAIMQHKGIKALENVDLLSEADKKIEKESMMKMMALILSMAGGSLATGPIGALADMGYNAVDFWKNEDLAITMLKQLPQPYGIPKEFHMRKTILDNIGAFLGMIPLLGPAAKVAKVGKLAAKYGFKMSEITELSKVIGKEMASLHKSENIHNIKFQETVNNVVLSKTVEGKGAKFGEHGSEVKKIADLSKNIDISKLGKIKEGEKYNINGENYTVIKYNKKLVFKSKKSGELFIIDKNQAGKDFLVKLDNNGNIIKNKDNATAINDVKKVEREIIDKKQVNKNALLTNEQRIDKLQELLGGKKLSKEQKDAILKAHEVGKDREGAGVFNYTQAEISQKAKILKDAGFDKNEVRILMENGIVGKVDVKIGKFLEPIKDLFSKSYFNVEELEKIQGEFKEGDKILYDGKEYKFKNINKGGNQHYIGERKDEIVGGYDYGILTLEDSKGNIKTIKVKNLNTFEKKFKKVEDIEKINSLDIKTETLKIFNKKEKNKHTIDLIKKYPNLKPIGKIEVGGKEFLFSKVIDNGDYKEVVGYVEVNGKIETRVFYKSNSAGGWRSTPGINQGGQYSKGDNVRGYSYTITTKVDNKLDNYLNTLELEKGENISKEFGIYSEEFNTIFPLNSKNFRNETSLYNDKGLLDLFREKSAGTWKESFKNNSREEIINYIHSLDNKYPKGFLPDFSKKPIRTEYIDHTIEGNTKIDIFEGTLNGKTVEWHMAQSEENPNKIWIANIKLKDGDINSFGVDSKFINSGILTSKPYEYGNQLPNSLHSVREGKYFDITDVLAELKPIKEYKKSLKNLDNITINNNITVNKKVLADFISDLNNDDKIIINGEKYSFLKNDDGKNIFINEKNRYGYNINVNDKGDTIITNEYTGKSEIVNNFGKEELKKQIDNINGLSGEKLVDFNKNLDFISSNIINNLGKSYIPKHSVTIEGREFLLTDKFTGNREDIIGYIKVNGVYEPRLFYFSQSGGNWHVSAGIRKGQRPDGTFAYAYSKGEKWGLGYEKGTVLNSEFAEKLSKIPRGKEYIGNFKNLYENLGFSFDKYQKTTNEVHRINITQGFENNSFARLQDENLNIQETKNIFSNINVFGIDENFSKIRKGKSMRHKYLGEVSTDIAETKLNGKDVEIVFAKADNSPELVWIEDIRFKDAKMNSFGFSSEKIEGGLLTAKPIEYTFQIPKGFRKNNNFTRYNKDKPDEYTDIRELMQGNPLIKAYKNQLGNLDKKVIKSNFASKVEKVTNGLNFNKANSVEDVLQILKNSNGINGRNGQHYSYEVLKSVILEVVNGERKITAITRTDGLRGTVAKLIDEGKIYNKVESLSKFEKGVEYRLTKEIFNLEEGQRLILKLGGDKGDNLVIQKVRGKYVYRYWNFEGKDISGLKNLKNGIIGRNLFSNESSSYVSGNHLRIKINGGNLQIEDISTNGTEFKILD